MPSQSTGKDIPANIAWLSTIHPENCIIKGPFYLLCKRIMDLSLVILALPLWLPFILMIAICVKISSPKEPVFFSQLRAGKGGRLFKMYKFRTMATDAEDRKKELAHLNELTWPDFKIKDDPRISSLGKFFRRTSIDEIPQLFNVLYGNMSLVGPRPTSFGSETYKLWQTERLDVYPGITGLWQIIARGSTEFDVRLRLDIAYIERRCLWLDFQILMRTFTSILKHRGTY